MPGEVLMMTRVSQTISDIMVMARRGILKYLRLPQLLVFNALFNIIMLLLFNYVFGGAIQAGGMNYIQYFLPGYVAQTVVFGSTQTSVAIAEDLSKGLLDRFRSLPMSRSAFLTGRVISDAVRYFIMLLVILTAGIVIGFRFQNGAGPAIAGLAIILLFGIALTWVAVFIGVSVKDVETAQIAGFVWVFPLVFASSAYVPIQTMPGWLQAFAKVNPVTPMVDTVRALFLGGAIWGSLWEVLAWSMGIILVFLFLAIRRYRLLTA
jgi:ABC transporter DrrB family efflux protein